MSLLIVNCLLNERLAQDFNQAARRFVKLSRPGLDLAIQRAGERRLAGQSAQRFTHLIISGSEASALDDNPWDQSLIDLVLAFIEEKRAVLGICYGHQFIVRALLGKDHLRKRFWRVWGWLAVPLKTNALFDNLREAVFVVVNSDEVFDLPENFEIIASADHCPVMAFQYDCRPVWGVQFHPEYDLEEAKSVFKVVTDGQDEGGFEFRRELRHKAQWRQNMNLFRNFLASGRKSGPLGEEFGSSTSEPLT